MSDDVICGTGWGKFKWNEKGRSPIVLVFGPGVCMCLLSPIACDFISFMLSISFIFEYDMFLAKFF